MSEDINLENLFELHGYGWIARFDKSILDSKGDPKLTIWLRKETWSQNPTWVDAEKISWSETEKGFEDPRLYLMWKIFDVLNAVPTLHSASHGGWYFGSSDLFRAFGFKRENFQVEGSSEERYGVDGELETLHSYVGFYGKLRFPRYYESPDRWTNDFNYKFQISGTSVVSCSGVVRNFEHVHHEKIGGALVSAIILTHANMFFEFKRVRDGVMKTFIIQMKYESGEYWGDDGNSLFFTLQEEDSNE